MKYVLGIDPGLDGALAYYDMDGDEVIVYDMPTLKAGTKGTSTNKRLVNEVELARIIDNHAADTFHAYVEKVNAMPKQGVTSSFNFGVSFGVIKGVLGSNFIATTYVSPSVWKASLSVTAAKESSLQRASQLLPKHAALWPLKKHDGRAEAALLAMYGSRRLANMGL